MWSQFYQFMNSRISFPINLIGRCNHMQKYGAILVKNGVCSKTSNLIFNSQFICEA
jgi:hypothetical protein